MNETTYRTKFRQFAETRQLLARDGHFGYSRLDYNVSVRTILELYPLVFAEFLLPNVLQVGIVVGTANAQGRLYVDTARR